MEIKFNSKLRYQEKAINSVIGLFKGQSIMSSRFSLSSSSRLDTIEGIGNKFDISLQDIEENFIEVQKSNSLNENTSLESLDFTIEMETGTGKTYVYLKTILELYKTYGFSKYVIVVPSVAIKEGVKKTLDITRNHFEDLYNNLSYYDFVFDSKNLTDLENFAKDDNIQIMIITIQSFTSERNKIRQKGEDGIIPMDYISSANPIVIIDEPQTTSSSNLRKEAISDLNPLFTLQYSATPKDADNLIYKLDAVDAYNKHLVKKIEVDAFDAADYQDKPYIQLDSTKQNKKSGKRTANLYLIVNGSTGFTKKLVKNLEVGDYLHVPKVTNNSAYDGYRITNIGTAKGNEFVCITDGDDRSKKIYLNQIINDINQEPIRQNQIEETIREHLKKELKLAKKNIKVLSLFFIDEVKNYRDYDREDGKGKYARWFESLYQKVLNSDDDFKKLPDYIRNVAPEDVHDGYFSIDKKKWANTTGTTNKDNSTYEKIMKDKEKLLNPKDNLRFIFSHSALKEGWDNPNVFQICTLIETQSDMSKRQKIGRGLRLCVDGDGNRIDENYGDGEEFKNINRLTVLANESFDNFASSLQKEMEEDGIQFAVIEKKLFKGIKYIDKDGNENKIRDYDANVIIRSLYKQKLIDKNQKITKKWKTALQNGEIELPSDYESIKGTIIQIVDSKVPGNYISNKKDRITIKLDEEKLETPEFNNLWDRIKFQTKYQVELDTDALIENCVFDMGRELKYIQKNKVTHTKTDLKMKNEIKGITRTKRSHFIDVEHDEIPNVVKDLQDKTHLTRKTIIEILVESNKRHNTFEKLLINPTEYFNKTLEIIQNNLAHMLVKNIEYIKTDNKYNKLEFNKEFTAYLDDDKLVKSDKSIYEYINCDSKGVEVSFAKELERSNDVQLFVKLPNWFKIKTPVGPYNPDWAITLKVDGEEETYFVIETKGTSKAQNIRQSEQDKIDCSTKHFEALGEVTYDKCVTFDEFVDKFLFEPF